MPSDHRRAVYALSGGDFLAGRPDLCIDDRETQNHSCDPNAYINAIYVDDADFHKVSCLPSRRCPHELTTMRSHFSASLLTEISGRSRRYASTIKALVPWMRTKTTARRCLDGLACGKASVTAEPGRSVSGSCSGEELLLCLGYVIFCWPGHTYCCMYRTLPSCSCARHSGRLRVSRRVAREPATRPSSFLLRLVPTRAFGHDFYWDWLRSFCEHVLAGRTHLSGAPRVSARRVQQGLDSLGS
jgi:hypothetical protein